MVKILSESRFLKHKKQLIKINIIEHTLNGSLNKELDILNSFFG